MASADRVLDLLKLEREPEKEGLALSQENYREDIEFQNVSFAYPKRSTVLHQVSLRIPGRGFVGLVGSTGSGKSTMVKLLLRFYEPTEGEVRIGDHPLRTLRLAELRSAIGWVSQDVFLFHGTVHDNISLGRPDASREAVVAAARAAELHEFIVTLPRGYDTVLGDFGATLSGGQKQRLSIARAIVKDPAVLILDEATSAVDNETEAAIQRSIARIARGRTVIAVAHRLSTVRHADTIFVLEEGQVVENGTHRSLLDRGERYAQLWRMQIGEADPMVSAELH